MTGLETSAITLKLLCFGEGGTVPQDTGPLAWASLLAAGALLQKEDGQNHWWSPKYLGIGID